MYAFVLTSFLNCVAQPDKSQSKNMSMFHRLSGRNGFSTIKTGDTCETNKKEKDRGAFGHADLELPRPQNTDAKSELKYPNEQLTQSQECKQQDTV
jgi:hypothetical protein